VSEERPAAPDSILVESPAAPEGADPREVLDVRPKVLVFFDFA
jgi:hypothetical protein